MLPLSSQRLNAPIPCLCLQQESASPATTGVEEEGEAGKGPELSVESPMSEGGSDGDMDTTVDVNPILTTITQTKTSDLAGRKG